jgi:hypothetical protein
MWPAAGTPDGTFYFENQPNMLDQFLANKHIATADAHIKVDPTTVEIFKHPPMVNTGTYPKPIPFGGMGKPRQSDRLLRPLSDHHDRHRR